MKTTTPATKILNKIYRQHLIKLARGQSYASNPGGSTPATGGASLGAKGRGTVASGRGSSRTVTGRVAPHPAFMPTRKTPGWMNSMGEGLNQAGSAAWNYGGKQTLLPAMNALDSIPTFAIGAANTLGGGVGNVISGLGYGVGAATDALGATTGGKQWVADNMWKHTNNAVYAGLQDMAGSVADAATGGAYDYNGTFADPGKHPGTAVQQNRSAIRDELRQTAGPSRPRTNRGGVGGRGHGAGAMPITAEQVFNTVNGVSDFAASSAVYGGAGRGVNVAAKALKGAPLLNAAANTPVVGKPLAAAGNWLAGKAPEANMFAKSPLGYYQSMLGQNPAYAAMGAAGEVGELGSAMHNAAADPVQEHKTYNESLPQLAQQYAEDTHNIHVDRGTAHTHAMTNAMLQDPAIQNRMGHGAVPPEAAAAIAHEQLPEEERAQAFAEMSANATPPQETLADTTDPQAGGGQMNVADPQATDSQQPAPPEPTTFAKEMLPDAPPEVQQQVSDSAGKVQQAAAENPNAAKAVLDPTGEAAKELEPAAFEALKNEKAQEAPTDNPNAYGDWVNGLMTQFNEMDPMAKVALGLGLGTGVIGLISGLMGGGIGSFLLGALGLGAAGAVGASAGMFGEGGSQFMGDMAYNLGTMTGMVPESADLSALKGDNALQRLMAQHSGKIGTRNEVKQQIADVREQAGKLQQLMSLPLGDDAKVRLIQRLDPSFKTVDEGRQALANAQQILAAYNDPKSELNQKLTQGENYSKLEGLQGDLAEQGVGLLNKFPGGTAGAAAAGRLVADSVIPGGSALMNMASQGIQDGMGYVSGLFKGSSDMNIAQRIIMEELTMKAARCWAGYEPVPGKKPYSDGSCRPVGSKKKKKKKTEKKAAGPVLPQSASPPVESFSKTPFDAQHMVQTLGMHASTKPQMAYNRAMHLWRKGKFTPDQFNKLRDKYQGLPPRPPAAQAAPVTAPQSSAEQAYQQWRAQQGL